MTKDQKPTIQDVLIAINQFSTDVDKRFANIDHELFYIKGRLTQMVTKDYLDDKLSDLRGEFFLKTGLAKKRTA